MSVTHVMMFVVILIPKNYNRFPAGQERYKSITKAYYRGAVGAVVVYDLTSQKVHCVISSKVKSNLAHVGTLVVSER